MMRFAAWVCIVVGVPGLAQGALVAQYTHEWADPLVDETGHGFNLANNGAVQFVSPGSADWFNVGQTVAEFPFSTSKSLAIPAGVYPPHTDFTFTALVRRDGARLNTGHQTIFSSNRFRLQWRITRNNVPGVGMVAVPGTEQLNLDLRDAGTARANGMSPRGSFGLEEWYFVAMRFKAATGEVDAFLQTASGTLAPPVIHLAPSFNIGDLTGFRIGLDGLSGIGSGDAFAGEIDGVRFYDTWLDNRQLQGVLQQEYWAPEPATWLSLTLGGLVLAGILRRRRD